jgi:hypothetical protein
VDGEPDDEDHDNDLESDLQPAHRAEALDVLAAIELRWALLRERVYVEKMESLGWEEELVKQGPCWFAYLLTCTNDIYRHPPRDDPPLG